MESRVAVLSTRWYSLPCLFLSPLKLPHTFTQPPESYGAGSLSDTLRFQSVKDRGDWLKFICTSVLWMRFDKLLILIPQRVYTPKLSLYKFQIHLFHHCFGLKWFWMGSRILVIRDFCVQKGGKSCMNFHLWFCCASPMCMQVMVEIFV